MPEQVGRVLLAARVSIASSSVLGDAAQPLHEPLQPQPRDAVLDAEQLDVAAVGLQVRPHAVERLAHPRPPAATG